MNKTTDELMNHPIKKTESKAMNKKINDLISQSKSPEEEQLKEKITVEPKTINSAQRISFSTFQLVILSVLCTLISSLFLTAESPSKVTKKTKTKPKLSQYCTAIKVPTSTNLPIVVAGQEFKSPQDYSAAFKPILSTVELPKGYRAVGGGAGFVIACTE